MRSACAGDANLVGDAPQRQRHAPAPEVQGFDGLGRMLPDVGADTFCVSVVDLRNGRRSLPRAGRDASRPI